MATTSVVMSVMVFMTLMMISTAAEREKVTKMIVRVFLEELFETKMLMMVIAVVRMAPTALMAEIVENIEDIIKIGSTKRLSHLFVLPKLVVLFPLLLVRQYIVRFGYLTELVLCILFLVLVRMVFDGQLAKSFLDLLLGGVPWNAKYFVIIFGRCCLLDTFSGVQLNQAEYEKNQQRGEYVQDCER